MKIKAFERKRQEMAESSACYWRDGNTIMEVQVALKDPAQAKPFVVRLSRKGWIPVNVIVMGADEDEAVDRLLAALRYCVEHEYDRDRAGLDPQNRRILNEFNQGKLEVEAVHFNPFSIVKCDWCSHGF